MSEEYTVTFKGFKNRKQALDFARWFEGSGEQGLDYWTLETTPAWSGVTDGSKGFYKQLKDGNVEVYMKITEDED